MKQEGNADRSDGIAYTTTEKPYEICIVEGSRPYVVDDTKEMSDYVQNARAGKDIINYTVVSEVKLKRAPPLQFKSYMVQSIGLSLRFYLMDYLGMYTVYTNIIIRRINHFADEFFKEYIDFLKSKHAKFQRI